MSRIDYRYPNLYVNDMKSSVCVTLMNNSLSNGKHVDPIDIKVFASSNTSLAYNMSFYYGRCHLMSGIPGPASHISFSSDNGSSFAFFDESESVDILKVSNGSWSDWKFEKDCKQPCGPEYFPAWRSCDNPMPHPKSFGCSGNSTTTISCNHKPCGDKILMDANRRSISSFLKNPVIISAEVGDRINLVALYS